MSPRSARETMDKIREKRLQLFSPTASSSTSSKGNANTKALTPTPSAGYAPAYSAPYPGNSEFTSIGSSFGYEASGSPGPPLPNLHSTYGSATFGATAFGQVAPNPYGSFYSPAQSGSSSASPNPPISLSNDAEIARQLQEEFDTEYLPLQGINPSASAWSHSQFESDLELAHSLAQGYDQYNGSPVPTPQIVKQNPQVDEDEAYARQLQEELDHDEVDQGESIQVNSGNSYTTPKQHFTASGPASTPDEPTVEIDLEADVAPLHQFGQEILKTECAHCRKHLLYSEKDIIKLTKKWLSTQGEHILGLFIGLSNALISIAFAETESNLRMMLRSLQRNCPGISQDYRPKCISPDWIKIL
jgi:hypothetical protein